MHSRSSSNRSTWMVVCCCQLLMLVTAGCNDESWWGAWHRHGGGKPSSPPEAGSGAAGSGPAAPSGEPSLPVARGECPTLANGTVEFLGIPVRLWVGERRDDVRGPLVFYWHGTGSQPGEAEFMFSAGLPEVLEQGGVVVALAGTTGRGENTSTAVWSTGDFEVADEVLACARQQRNIDPRRIYATGCSAGGVHASVMAYERSSYVAAVTPASGGILDEYELQDPDDAPAVMTVHGADELDVVFDNFAEASRRFARDIAAQGGFAVDCNTGMGHCQLPAPIKAAQWQFLKDHPYGVDPEPYAVGLPTGMPDYCAVVTP